MNRNFTGKDGEKKEETTFVDVDAFGKQAEVLAKYCAKGKPLLVEGRLKLDQWEDKNTGEKRSRLGVVLEGFQFAGEGKGESRAEANEERRPERKPVYDTQPGAADDEDMPF